VGEQLTVRDSQMTCSLNSQMSAINIWSILQRRGRKQIIISKQKRPAVVDYTARCLY